MDTDAILVQHLGHTNGAELLRVLKLIKSLETKAAHGSVNIKMERGRVISYEVSERVHRVGR